MKWVGYLFLLLAPAVPWTQMRIDRSRGTFRAQEEILYLRSSDQVRRLFPGFEMLMADLYWIRTVQYFGTQTLAGRRFELLQPLLDITVGLDPKFEMAYRYGAFFLAESAPGGAGQPEAAVALLDRGLRLLPRAWYMHQNRAFVVYLYLGDKERAARGLEAAVQDPGAPFWLKTMAAAFYAQGGRRDLSRRIWLRLVEEFQDERFQNMARAKVQLIDALDEVDALNALAQDIASKTGNLPPSLRDLVAASGGRLPLLDPAGVPFDYDAGRGRTAISARSPLWRPEPVPGGAR